MKRHISGFITRNGRGELETLLHHVLDQLRHGLGLESELAREVVTHIALPQGADRILQIVQKSLSLRVESERQISAVLAELLVQVIDVVAQLANAAGIALAI